MGLLLGSETYGFIHIHFTAATPKNHSVISLHSNVLTLNHLVSGLLAV